MSGTPDVLLGQLHRLKAVYQEESTASKIAILKKLEQRELNRPSAVKRLHDILCYLAAYPDNRQVHSFARRMLKGYPDRRDVKRFRRRLANTGIAGTTTHYSFFAPTALWLASRWPNYVTVDWAELTETDMIEELLRLLAAYAESPGLDEAGYSVRQWVELLKGPGETDAAFLIRRFGSLELDTFLWELLYNRLNLPIDLAPGATTPSRTHARYPVRTISYGQLPHPPIEQRLPTAATQPPESVVTLAIGTARRIIDLARCLMVANNRELDAFSFASPRDVTLVDSGRGLSFALIGVVPERRLLLESLYGYLAINNGVPVGYGTISALYGSAEIAFNIFEPFRGAESRRVFVKLLAVAHHQFGCDTFTLAPYQLGEDNAEAIRSGAWWFYQKLGFRARDADVLRLMEKELGKIKSRPGHRSSPATLRRLASANVYLELGRSREDVMGTLELANVGLVVTAYLARRFGSDRAQATRVCPGEAANLLGVPRIGSSLGERLARERWAPLVLVLPGIGRWPAEDRQELAAVIDAKGGQCERDYVLRFDHHRRLRSALRNLARRAVP